MKRLSILALLFACMVMPLTATASTVGQLGKLYSFQHTTSHTTEFAINFFGQIGTDIYILDGFGGLTALHIGTDDDGAGSEVILGSINSTVNAPGFSGLSFTPNVTHSSDPTLNEYGQDLGGTRTIINTTTPGAFDIGIDAGLTVLTAVVNTSNVLTVTYVNGDNVNEDNEIGFFTISDVTEIAFAPPVPIPAAGIMLISALAGLLVVGRRGKKDDAKESGMLATA